MKESATPRIVSRDEWERARAELLVREKAHTRAGDELAAARRRLPMTRMEPVMVVGPDGPVRLHDVFEGRRMLIVYHFMWNPGAPHEKQCEGCTHSQTAMNSAVRAYLAERDVTLRRLQQRPVERDRSPIETSWAGRRRGTRRPTPETCWRPETGVTSAATFGSATRCSKRMKRSGEGSRPCCPLSSCSTSLRTVDRRRGRTRLPAGRSRTRLGRGGGVTADPLLSGRAPTQRSNRIAALTSSSVYTWYDPSEGSLQCRGRNADTSCLRLPTLPQSG